VTLRWLVQQERVATIPKSADPQRRRQNFDIWGFTLSADEMARIHALDRGERQVNPDGAPNWER
jgi:diketogulonate reductase-like aldo/keto reductase